LKDTIQGDSLNKDEDMQDYTRGYYNDNLPKRAVEKLFNQPQKYEEYEEHEEHEEYEEYHEDEETFNDDILINRSKTSELENEEIYNVLTNKTQRDSKLLDEYIEVLRTKKDYNTAEHKSLKECIENITMEENTEKQTKKIKTNNNIKQANNKNEGHKVAQVSAGVKIFVVVVSLMFLSSTTLLVMNILSQDEVVAQINYLENENIAIQNELEAVTVKLSQSNEIISDMQNNLESASQEVEDNIESNNIESNNIESNNIESNNIFPRTHIVERGDNLTRLSTRFYGNIYSIDKIRQANNLQSDYLYIGQVLTIPQ
jgi:LysM repeat protein